MSSIGNGVAAGVAQTALQAQQVGRKRSTEKSRQSHAAEHVREIVEQHLEAVEEGDEAETPSQLRIDQHIPEKEHGQSLIELEHRAAESQDAEQLTHPSDPDETPNKADPAKPGRPLYRHLDIKA